MSIDIRLSDLLARTVEEGECLLWNGGLSDGRPLICIGGRREWVRRLVYLAAHGEIPKQLQIGVKCSNPLCLHPDHLVARTRKQAMRGVKHNAGHGAKIANTKRKKTRLRDESVAAIRSSDGAARELAEQFGVSTKYIYAIKAHKARLDYSNPFVGLGAR